MKRVAVTGIGAVSPLGLDARSTWRAAVAGESGVDWISAFDASAYPVRIAAEVKGFDPTSVASAKEARKLDRNVLLALAAAREHGPLVLALRVADRDPQQEAIHLRLGQGVGPVVLGRVLGREHHERRVERVGGVVDRDLALAHRLEQRRLRARGGAVDLVGEHDVGEDRPAPELEHLAVLVVDRHPDDVRRQQVAGELDPTERAAERCGQRASQRGLTDARNVLDQQVPA